MNMQVATLSMGNSVAALTPLELKQEKKAPLPMEQRADAEKPDAALPSVLLPGHKTDDRPKPMNVNLQQTAADLEKISLAFDRRLKFVVDQESRQILIKVIDNETDKVIKVLPPEELQRLHSRIKETIGFLFDKTV